MAYPKPLAPKTIDKMYIKLGVDKEQKDFIHTFYAASMNLYGTISLDDAWEVYKELSCSITLPKFPQKLFFEISDILRREPLDYYMFEVDELFEDERRVLKHRQLVRKDLIDIGAGANKFSRFYTLYHKQEEECHFIPKNFLSFAVPKMTKAEKTFLEYLGNLKINMKEAIGPFGPSRPGGKLGQRLKAISFLNAEENHQIQYYSGLTPEKIKPNPKQVELIKASARRNEAEKLYYMFKDADNIEYMTFEESFEMLQHELNEVGVSLSSKEAHKLAQFLEEVHNTSHRLCQLGWAPQDLYDLAPHNQPAAITLTPTAPAPMGAPTMDIAEIERHLKELGLK